MNAPLILGSASPRRAALLAQLGAPFEVRAADVDETPKPREEPVAYVRRMAREKARALAPQHPGCLLLTADTSVFVGPRILGKPSDANHARQMLRDLSARSHTVCTALSVVLDERLEECCVSTSVEFIELDDALIEAYLATDEPWDKAGAYAIQGLAASFVRAVHGSVSNVIGLPLAETRELFARFDLHLRVAPGADAAMRSVAG